MWNAVTYFENTNNSLKLTKGKYTFCRVTGLNYLEEILANSKASTAYLGVDDTDDGVTIQHGGAWFNRRAVVVYVLKKYKFGDEADREEKTNETRLIHKKLLAKLIKDSSSEDGLMFLDKTRFPYHEVPGMFASGTCGLYFIVTLNEPVALVYNADDYE
jgi:hypothetical protein